MGRCRVKAAVVVVVPGGSVTRCRKLMFLSGLGASRSLWDIWGGVNVLAGFYCSLYRKLGCIVD